MKELLQKANFNDTALKRYVSTLTVNQLNSLSEPCYFPNWQPHYHELLNASGLDDKEVKAFSKRFHAETEAVTTMAKYGKVSQQQIDPGSNLLVVLMYHFLLKKDQQTYSSLMILLLVRQYGNQLHKMFPKKSDNNKPFCKPEVFSYTLDHLNPTHLFVREKTIANAIFHLSTEIRRRFTSGILELDANKISKMIYEAKSRISQSVRSFVEAYYSNNEKGFGTVVQREPEEGEDVYPQELEKENRVAEDVSKKICVFKEIDYKAIDQAKILTIFPATTCVSSKSTIEDSLRPMMSLDTRSCSETANIPLYMAFSDASLKA